MAHYYTNRPDSPHHEQTFQTEIAGQRLSFKTDSGVFSRDQVDYGSRVLLETVIESHRIGSGNAVLELGSGYGPIILSLMAHYPEATGYGVEINERAYQLALDNQRLNVINNCQFELGDATVFDQRESYHHVVTNPPIRAGKQVIQSFVDRAYDALVVGGCLWVVIQKKQGAPSMQKYMEERFGNVDRVCRDKGYWVLMSEKES